MRWCACSPRTMPEDFRFFCLLKRRLAAPFFCASRAPAGHRGVRQDSAFAASNGNAVAPARTIAGSAASSNSLSPSTTTRIRPAWISSSNLTRIGSGSEAPTSAEDHVPIIAPARPTAAAPAMVSPTGGTTVTGAAQRRGHHVGIGLLAGVGNRFQLDVRAGHQQQVVVVDASSSRRCHHCPCGCEVRCAEYVSGLHEHLLIRPWSRPNGDACVSAARSGSSRRRRDAARAVPDCR